MKKRNLADYKRRDFKKKGKKSYAASSVLQLMDADYSYSEALKIVLNNDKRLSRKKLEKELNIYI